MIDVNKITSTLAKLPDALLQKYAQLNKADPYIMALAMSESNRRKAVRSAAPAQQGMQEQPKVVDQMVAEMAPVDAMGNVTGYAGGGYLPEEHGIGRLPTGDMNFADGGIVAFAGGGDVEHYQVGGSTAMKVGPDFVRLLQRIGIDYLDFARMSPADKAAALSKAEQAKAAATAAPTAAPAAQAAQGASTAYNAGKAASPYLEKAGRVAKAGALPVIGGGLAAAQGLSEIDSAKAFYDDPNVPLLEKGKQFARTGANTLFPLAGGIVGSGLSPVLGTAAGTAAGTGVAALIDDEGEALKQYRAKNEPPKGPTATENRAAVNKADAADRSQPAASTYGSGSPAITGSAESPSSVLSPSTLRSTGAGAGTRTGAGGTSSGGSNDIFSMESIKAAQKQAMGNSDYELGAMRNQLVEIRANTERRAQEALDRRNKEIAEEGDIYKDRSDRLAARGKKLEAQADQNLGLAVLNAGLAIMSTPGGLGMAIGKGAQVGTAQYAAGLKDLRAAQERLDEANDRIEDLRLNRKDLNKRDIRALEKERDSALAEGEKLTFNFAKDIYGLNRTDASKVFESYLQGQRTKYEQEQQTKRTMAQISASNDGRAKQLWAGLMQKHGNDPVAAAKEYNAIEAGDKPAQAAEKLVQDRVGEYEKANKMQLAMMTPAQRAAELRNRTEQYRKDIYTQLNLTPKMGAGSSGNSGFKLLGVESP